MAINLANLAKLKKYIMRIHTSCKKEKLKQYSLYRVNRKYILKLYERVPG